MVILLCVLLSSFGQTNQLTIGYGCRQNQEAKLKIVGGLLTDYYPRVREAQCGYTSVHEYVI